MYKLLATDLDGTLIGSDGVIPQQNISAIHRALEKGVRVCLCSGRSFLSLRRFEAELGISQPGCYGICFNGSMVYETDTGRPIRDVRLDNKLALRIIRELKRFGGDIMVYAADKMFTERATDGVRSYSERSRIPFTVIHSFDDVTEDVSKVLLRGPHDMLMEASRHMLPVTAGDCNQFFTERTLLEYTNLEANKGAALMFLASHLGLDRDEVIAVGDNFNDIHMLREAGLGVAVKNAEEEAKAAADYVTRADNNEGALAEVVERFICKI